MTSVYIVSKEKVMSDLKSIDELNPGDLVKAVLKMNRDKYVIGRYIYTGLFNMETITLYIHMMYDHKEHMFDRYPNIVNGLFHPTWEYYKITKDEAMVEML